MLPCLELHPFRTNKSNPSVQRCFLCHKLVLFIKTKQKKDRTAAYDFLTFHRPSDGKKTSRETDQCWSTLSSQSRRKSHLIPNSMCVQLPATESASVLCSAFIYRPAVTQPDLRACLQSTPTTCPNALLSVGCFPKHTPSPRPTKTRISLCELSDMIFSFGQLTVNKNNKNNTEHLKQHTCVRVT